MKKTARPARAHSRPLATPGLKKAKRHTAKMLEGGASSAIDGRSFEAGAILDAIRNNEIDALVIGEATSERVFALRSMEELRQAESDLRHAGVERRIANAARKVLEKRFETLATHAPIGIFMNDAVGQCVYANPRACEIVGKSPKDALLSGLIDKIHPDDKKAFLRERNSAAARGLPFEAEIRYCGPEGQIVWVTEKSVSLPRIGGKSSGRIGTITDVTERKVAEEALRESRHHLQALLEQRERLTQDLHDCCIQSVYAIGLNLQSCRQLLDDHPEAARMVGNSAADLNLVIQDLRTFISGTGAAAKPDLAHEIDRAAQPGRDQGITFVVKIDTAVTDLLPAAHALHVLQIAREAISNATRHSRARTIKVRLSGRDNFIALIISDDGVGFDPRKQNGSGLGLHHIEARARALRGRSKIVSAPKKGARIDVRVPLPR